MKRFLAIIGSRPGVVLLSLWGLAFSLSCRVSSSSLLASASDLSAAGTLVSGTRSALAAFSFEKAEEYFHGGVRRVTARAFEATPLQKLALQISPEQHVHLHGTTALEMMPWLWLSLRLDPRNLDRYLVTAFWLRVEGRRPDLALQVLQEAQCQVPCAYHVQLEKGRIYLHDGRLRQARAAFHAGLAFWPSGEKPDDPGARYEKARMLLYKALIEEAAGERQNAVRALAGVLELFPERLQIRSRMTELQSGNQPSLLASGYWRDMLKEDDERRSRDACERQGGTHDHGEEEGHSGRHEGMENPGPRGEPRQHTDRRG